MEGGKKGREGGRKKEWENRAKEKRVTVLKL